MNNNYENFLHKAAGNVWTWWEENKFEDEGLGEINKASQFSDWVDEVDDEDLASIGGVIFESASQLRAVINKGINKYFDEVNNELWENL